MTGRPRVPRQAIETTKWYAASFKDAESRVPVALGRAKFHPIEAGNLVSRPVLPTLGIRHCFGHALFHYRNNATD